MAFFDFLNDPNIQQGLGNMGAELAGPGSFASAINPAGLIRNVQNQKAGKELLNMILGAASGGGQNMTAADLNAMESGMGRTDLGGYGGSAPVSIAEKLPQAAPLNPNGMSIDPEMQKFMGLGITPKGAEGLDSFKYEKTGDGHTVTMKAPTSANLNSYGQNTPPEAVAKAQPKAGTDSPFWQTLFA